MRSRPYQLLEKQEKISELFEQESKKHQHAMLYEVLLLRYWKNGIARSQKEALMLNDLLLEEYQILNSPGKKPFELLQMHLYFQSIYFQMTGNATGSLNVFRELDELFQQHQSLWKDAPIYYFHMLDGILFDLRWMNRYEEMNYFLARLNGMPSSGESLAIMIRTRVLEHDLNRSVDQNNFGEAGRLLQKHLATVTRELQLLPIQTSTRFAFTMVRVWMGTGDYSAPLKIINSTLNQSTTAMNHAQYVLFELMNLQINALMNKTDYLYYAIRSVERKLKAERKLHGVEQLIVSLIKRTLALKPLARYEEQIKALEQNPYERLLIKELCLKEWLHRLQVK
jgi:hypothetical protein